MLKTILHKIGEILRRPFRESFLFLIAFFFLISTPYILWQLKIAQGFNIYDLYLACHCFVLSYLISLLANLIRPIILRNIVQGILIVLAAVLYAANFYCIFALDFMCDADIVLLMLGTDIHETKEFASMMLPTWIIMAVLAVYLFFIILWLVSKRHSLNLGKKASWIAMGLLCLCIAHSIHNWRAWKDGPLKLIQELSSIDTTNDLKSHFSNPKVSIIDKNQIPDNVVLIIGESFARFHSSLYGYEKNTNPYLSSLHDQSLLFTLDSIDAPAPTTVYSLQYMLTTYSLSDAKDKNKKWYDTLSIIELMKSCGFGSYWFSNQARSGKFNFASRIFAEACDQYSFYQQEGSLDINNRHDIVLVDSTHQFNQTLSQQQHNFIVYHMMGSHYDYSMRYPEEFDRFSEKDYTTEPESHRPILASYDNSILYNDYVVYQIINLYKDKEAIIFYAPDHGQVMYRDLRHPDYHTHGKMNDEVRYSLGIDIPFMIYASPLYQKKHPETMQRIKYRQDHPKAWNSDDLPYLIMDLIGVKDINGEEVKPKSVLD